MQVQYLSFDTQISYFEKTKEAIKLRIGEAEAEKLCNNALYLIGLGMEMSIKLLITTSFSSFKKFHLLFKMKSDI